MGRCSTGSAWWLACIRKNSADHAESGVRKSIQRRQLRSACSEGAKPLTGRKRNTLNGLAPVTKEPRPAGCLRAPANAMAAERCRTQDFTDCLVATDTGLSLSDRMFKMLPSDSYMKKKTSNLNRVFGKDPSQPRKKQRRHAKSK